MMNIVDKPEKVALCRVCGGKGYVRVPLGKDPVPFRKERCPQCEGSGRVTVTAHMEFDIKPYRPKRTTN